MLSCLVHSSHGPKGKVVHEVQSFIQLAFYYKEQHTDTPGSLPIAYEFLKAGAGSHPFLKS